MCAPSRTLQLSLCAVRSVARSHFTVPCTFDEQASTNAGSQCTMRTKYKAGGTLRREHLYTSQVCRRCRPNMLFFCPLWLSLFPAMDLKPSSCQTAPDLLASPCARFYSLLPPHTRIAVRVSAPYREHAKSSASSQQTATTAPPGLGIAHVVCAAPTVNTTPYFCVCVCVCVKAPPTV